LRPRTQRVPPISSSQQGSSRCCVRFGVPVPRFAFFVPCSATSNPAPDISVEDNTNTVVEPTPPPPLLETTIAQYPETSLEEYTACTVDSSPLLESIAQNPALPTSVLQGIGVPKTKKKKYGSLLFPHCRHHPQNGHVERTVLRIGESPLLPPKRVSRRLRRLERMIVVLLCHRFVCTCNGCSRCCSIISVEPLAS
jgi:hypothetical protein